MSSSRFAIAVGYIAILGLAGLVAFVITLWRTQWRGIYLSILAFLVAAFAAYSTCVFFWSPPVAEVSIQKPVESARVESLWISVEGKVSPPDAKVQILVHPSSSGSAQSWWVQPPPNQSGGPWKGDICLGTETSGPGEYFQIIAVASPRPRWIDLLHYQCLQDGQRLDEIPALPRSEIITVWRSK